MRKFLVALALAVVPMTGAASLSACASFEQVAPKSARHALAEAEIMFVGVSDVTGALARRGVLPAADVQRLLTTYQTISQALDMAHVLVKAGDEVSAARTTAEILATLSAVSLQLSLIAEANPPQPVLPAPPVAEPTRFEI